MKVLANLICILSLVTSAFAADDWNNFSSPFPIKAMVPYGDGVLLATNGGIRFRSSTVEALYTTAHGLGDQSISAVVAAGPNVFSVSDNGIVAKIISAESWQVLSRSYAGSGVRVIPGMVRVAEDVMVIAFDDRLSFFSLKSNTSILTVERIADANLSINPVSAMEIQGDSLFVAVDGSLYVRKMDWKNLESDMQLFNPDSWKVVKKASLDKEPIKFITWSDGELVTYPTEGTRIWDDDGETRAVIDTFTTFKQTDKMVTIRGKVLKDSILYERDSIVKTVDKKTVVDRYYFKPKIYWVSLIPSSGGALLVGPQNIFHYNGKKLTDLTEYSRFPLKSVYELRALPEGGILAASDDGYFSHFNGRQWSTPTKALYGNGNMTNARGHDMKALSVLPGGRAFYHVWGLGYVLYSDLGQKLDSVFLSTDGHCMSSYMEDFPYSISISTTPAPDGKGFFASAATTKGYSLAYFDLKGNVSCADNVGSATFAGPMLTSVDEDGKWKVYVGTRKSPSLDANGDLDVFTFTPPNKRGGEISWLDTTYRKVYTDAPSTPLDMVYEPKTGYYWMVTGSSLVYWNKDEENLKTPLSTNGLTGANFTSIDVDSRGNLWVGTSNQGVYRLTPRSTSPDTLSVQHFTTRQGLLSDRVQDVAVDSGLGAVWFAHENGVSYYMRNDLRGTDGNMTDDAGKDVRVYPNPFRPDRHEYIVFDNVSDDAVINIYNRGGKLVASLTGEEVAGGRAEWRGRMKNGNLVAPGVYQYVIRGASKVRKGKLLIVH